MTDSYPLDDRPVEPPATPWWLIARGVAVASDPRSIILAALGVAAVRSGWAGLAMAMPKDRPPWLATFPVEFVPGIEGLGDPRRWLAAVVAPVAGLIAPFLALFSPDISARVRLQAAIACLWLLLMWGIFGTAIARVAVLRVARGERIGQLAALRFSLTRIGTTVAAPIAPIFVALLIGLAGAVVGLLDRLPAPVGPAMATILAPIPLVVGMLDAVILLGLALAWPLMIATVAAEGEDFYDAISRSYSYVNQRTARFSAYVAGAAVVGAIGVAAVGVAVVATLGLADWSLSLGAPRRGGFRFLDPTSADRSGLPIVAHFWTGAVKMLVAGWIYSYVWSAATIIYLLLRLDVDGSDVHELRQELPADDSSPS